ncbi:MAG: ABC transporter permease, partial [Gemmatimonadaceae bacterium]
MIIAERITSNIQIALDTLRANKLRSALTILGVVIGVSTVMTMAAIVQGIQDQIVRTIEIAGPTTFYVVKVFSQTPVNPDRLPKWIRVRPDLVEAEAERIRLLPEIGYAAIWAQNNGRLSYGAQRTQN